MVQHEGKPLLVIFDTTGEETCPFFHHRSLKSATFYQDRLGTHIWKYSDDKTSSGRSRDERQLPRTQRDTEHDRMECQMDERLSERPARAGSRRLLVLVRIRLRVSKLSLCLSRVGLGK